MLGTPITALGGAFTYYHIYVFSLTEGKHSPPQDLESHHYLCWRTGNVSWAGVGSRSTPLEWEGWRDSCQMKGKGCPRCGDQEAACFAE